MLIYLISGFRCLWGCCTEPTEHILDGTGYRYICLIPWDAAWWRKKGHITQGTIKLLLRGQQQPLLLLCFGFLFKPGGKVWNGGKSKYQCYKFSSCHWLWRVLWFSGSDISCPFRAHLQGRCCQHTHRKGERKETHTRYIHPDRLQE